MVTKVGMIYVMLSSFFPESITDSQEHVRSEPAEDDEARDEEPGWHPAAPQSDGGEDDVQSEGAAVHQGGHCR